MTQALSAQVGLFGFAVAILVGLQAQNSPVTILSRALVVMFVAALIGQMVAWAGRAALRERLQARKLQLDQEHLKAIREMESQAVAADAAPAASSAPSTR
ncbi:MAG: hypothetical protein SF069_10730 [Phycisphaerae bacterium]|nr:hypothetical protein [Phycisphaerae bacterium]